ncbi:MAG: TerB family tellurite resistance protein [Pirellulaceae bacterium]|nr:TerB family tellurite resistance protein [Pirellulaceae bacterium]
MSMTPTQRVEILRACCCVAGADGEITPDELELIRNLASAEGVGEASLTAMIERSEGDAEFYKQQFNILKEQPLFCLDVLLQVCIANGKVKKTEFHVLKGLAKQLDISSEDFEERVENALKDLG